MLLVALLALCVDVAEAEDGGTAACCPDPCRQIEACPTCGGDCRRGGRCTASLPESCGVLFRHERACLEQRGLTLELVYTGDLFTNVDGGIETGAVYRGNIDLVLDFDLWKLARIPGGRFFLYFQNGHGPGFSEEKVGDFQCISNIESDDFTQLSEYWWEQSFFGGRGRLKVGKQDAACDFGASEYACDLINSSCGVIPTVPLPTFPDPALGVGLFVDWTDWFTLGAGLYDGAAEGGELGFETLFDDEGGHFLIAEAGVRTDRFFECALEGCLHVGAWYHTGDFDHVSDPRTFGHSYGVYGFLDQLLFEGCADGTGLGLFLQAGWAPSDRSEVSGHLGGGLHYRGPLRGRPDDILAFAIQHSMFSAQLAGFDPETAFELTYRIAVSDSFALQPSLQYIVNPGGTLDDSFAVGVRFEFVP